MNKSYNPFKMWGSWVGLIFGFFWMQIETRKSENTPLIFIF
jgi:hypothetical protein